MELRDIELQRRGKAGEQRRLVMALLCYLRHYERNKRPKDSGHLGCYLVSIDKWRRFKGS